MQTSDRSGIICDYCGITNSQDFTYYSYDFRVTCASGTRRPSLQDILSSNIIASFDICTSCHAQLSQKIIDNYQKVMNKRRAHLCEITGKPFSGTYNYYYCVVAQVDVKLSGQPYICPQCRKQTTDRNKPCECGSTNFIQPASINTVQRYLEFNLCEEAFQQFQQKAQAIQQRSNQWTTQS